MTKAAPERIWLGPSDKSQTGPWPSDDGGRLMKTYAIPQEGCEEYVNGRIYDHSLRLIGRLHERIAMLIREGEAVRDVGMTVALAARR